MEVGECKIIKKLANRQLCGYGVGESKYIDDKKYQIFKEIKNAIDSDEITTINDSPIEKLKLKFQIKDIILNKLYSVSLYNSSDQRLHLKDYIKKEI